MRDNEYDENEGIEPWYITHARASGHATSWDLKDGMRCLVCSATPQDRPAW